jgi:hypothetical protein
MLQEYEETLAIQKRDGKLKSEQEDFLCPEVKMMMNSISSKIPISIKRIQLYLKLTGQKN